MNNSAMAAKADSSGWEPKFPFDLVVAYEDTETRGRALHLYDHLAQQLLDDYDFQCSWWKFDHFASPVLLQEAADSAVDANMVILSIRAHRELPPIHQSWVNEWIRRRHSRKAALVVIVADTNQPERDATSSLTYLRNAARIGQMDFFLHGYQLPKSGSPFPVVPVPENILAQAQGVQGLRPRKSPVPRWGINE